MTRFTTTDQNNDALSYSYTVNATSSNGEEHAHDPSIQNGTGGPE